MPFYVKHEELAKISGRTKQSLWQARNAGTLPYEKLGHACISDIDDAQVQAFVFSNDDSWTLKRRGDVQVYRDAFNKRRANQEVLCAKTGMADYMFEPEQKDAPEEEHNQLVRKREAEIEYKQKQVENLDIKMQALTGDLINRTVVSAYIQKYLGSFNQQVLGFPTSGFVGEIYDLFKREEDGAKAIKEAERLFEKEMSRLIKESTESMRENPL